MALLKLKKPELTDKSYRLIIQPVVFWDFILFLLILIFCSVLLVCDYFILLFVAVAVAVAVIVIVSWS